MAWDRGAPIVLTADRTLMADYGVLLDGMMASSQTTTTPWPVVSALIAPRAPHPGGLAKVAPLGLRRVQAALIAGGFSPEDIAVVDDAHIGAVIGPNTRVVGIASGEPTGIGMSSTTMAGVAGGCIYPQVLFQRLLRRTRQLVTSRCPDARIVMGGPGAWQYAASPDIAAQHGVDHVVVGYAETAAPSLFRALVSGQDAPHVLTADGPAAHDIPRILGPSTMGVIEISRGCGLGCGFCTIGRVPMQHLPPDTILADARTNVDGGVTSIGVLSEDIFRYGGAGVHPNPDALLSLLSDLRAIPGMRLIQADHANIATIRHFSDEQLRAIHGLMCGDTGARHPWVNVGVESASGALLRRAGGGGKMVDISDEDWPGQCAEQLARLCRAGFSPMVSLLIGIPEETQEDIAATWEWVHSISALNVTVFPVLYAPVDGADPITRDDLTPLHWRLMRDSYELNFRRVPVLYADNQLGAGVAMWRRAALQLTGRGQVVLWRHLLTRLQRRSARG